MTGPSWHPGPQSHRTEQNVRQRSPRVKQIEEIWGQELHLGKLDLLNPRALGLENRFGELYQDTLRGVY